jgi:hypothetical protein
MNKKQKAAFNRLADAFSGYLKTIGWSALVVGSPRIQKPPGEREFNYEFVLRFTGGKIKKGGKRK